MSLDIFNNYKQVDKVASLQFAPRFIAMASTESYNEALIDYENSGVPRSSCVAASVNSSKSAIKNFKEINIIAPSRVNRPLKGAPLWLKERMKALRAMPPPTFDRMKTQLKASAEAREKSNDRDSS